jgi:nucleotide-binding universal stress UspA family protein
MSEGETNKSVIVAVDFSPDSEAALLWACGFAKLAKAPLLILHVVHDPAHAPGIYRKGDTDWSRPMSEMAKEMFEEFLDRMRAKHADVAALSSLKKLQVIGLPANRIIEVAEKEDAEHIVIGSRGRTGLPRILLGSVAERVVQTSRQPVTVVKSPEVNEES